MKYNRLGIFSFILHSPLSPLLQTIPMRKVFITYSSKGEKGENGGRKIRKRKKDTS
jgi:hypothetical protein